jgi:hypothetical protein
LTAIISADTDSWVLKIARQIKVEVIGKWLQGNSGDQIANEVHIGAGTVICIIKECRKDTPEF